MLCKQTTYYPQIKMENILYQRVNNALEQIRPHLKVDGGDVEIVEITAQNILRIRWMGNCEGCSMSCMTMRAGIEHSVKSQVPEIVSVEAVNGVA